MVETNNIDNLLKVVIDSVIDNVRNRLVGISDDKYLSLYFIYHLPRMRAYQYLVDP